MELSWEQTIKLGKVKVVQKLRELGIRFSSKLHYFKLCSILYSYAQIKAVTPALSIEVKRLERCLKAEKEARNIPKCLNAPNS